MTDPTLADRLEALGEKATAEWSYDGGAVIVDAARPHMRVFFLPSDHHEYASSKPNARLAVLLRNNLPAILAALRAPSFDAGREALMKAAEQFRFYEKSHRAKGTPDGDQKAETNNHFAAMCEAALRTSPLPQAQAPGAVAGLVEKWRASAERLKSMSASNANIDVKIASAARAMGHRECADELAAAIQGGEG